MPPSGTLSATDAPPGGRRSYALEGVSQWLTSQERLQIIDLGGINQQNVDYVTGMGHRLYADDLLRAYEAFFEPEEIRAPQLSAQRIEEFLDHCFDLPDQSADGALVWDTLQFLPPALAQAVLDRIHRILAPDSPMLALFHSESALPMAPPQQCRILDQRNIRLAPRGDKRPIVPFNPRAIERFFQRFRTLKFFLTRDNLQEVIARR
jgi:hypothetical protein